MSVVAKYTLVGDAYPYMFLFADSLHVHIGVRGMPERDIESLGVMGWGLDAARRFFRRRRRRRRRP